VGECKVNGDNVGQCNVIKERIKHVKTGGAMRLKWGDSILVVRIHYFMLLYKFVPVLHHKFIFFNLYYELLLSHVLAKVFVCLICYQFFVLIFFFHQ
jgi:hypothetical protein